MPSPDVPELREIRTLLRDLTADAAVVSTEKMWHRMMRAKLDRIMAAERSLDTLLAGAETWYGLNDGLHDKRDFTGFQRSKGKHFSRRVLVLPLPEPKEDADV